MALKFLFSTWFVISSGPGALLGESFSIACASCCGVIRVVAETASGYMLVECMSVLSAGGSDASVGSSVSLSCAAFLTFVVAPLIVGMYRCVGFESMYFLIVHIVFSSAVSTKFFQV